MPCSGLNSAASFTSLASKIRSIAVAPSRARPVWLVTSPTRLPASGREALRAEDVESGLHRRRRPRCGRSSGVQRRRR